MMKSTTAMKVLAAAGVVSALLAGTAFAGTWTQSGKEWHYVDDRGQAVTEGWIYDNGSWYYFQPNSAGVRAMATGWVKVGGEWYFLDNSSRGNNGALITGWSKIDGEWYYLDPNKVGATARNAEVDGYAIDSEGKAGGSRSGSSGTGVSRIIYVYEDGTTSESSVRTPDDEEEDFDSFTNGSGNSRTRRSSSSSGKKGVGPGSELGSYYEYSYSMPMSEKETYEGTDDTPSNYSGSEYRAYADLWDDDESGGSKDDYIKNNTSSSAYRAYQNSAKTHEKKVVMDDGSYYLYNSKTDSYDYYSKDGELEEDSEEDEDDEDTEDEE